MMLILTILVLGIAAGWAGQKIVAPRRPVDWTAALVQGLVGSFVGGLAVSLIAGDGFELRPSGILGSIGGAVIVVLVSNWWRTRR